MDIDTFVETYFADRKPQREGPGHYKACCPVHEDDTPSLSITEGEQGRILLNCHGCGAKAKDILPAIGAQWSDIMGSAPKRERPWSDFEKKWGRFVKDYPYRFEDRTIAFVKERKIKPDGKKTFACKTPTGDEAHPWEYKGSITEKLKAAGRKKPIYNLPEVLFGIRQGRTVWFVEGEKDADTLMGLRLLATTTAEGAGGGWQEHYAGYFDGAVLVAIVPDNDKPPVKHKNGKLSKGWQGQQYALTKWGALTAAGVPCKIVELPAELNGKPVKDVTDYIEAGGTPDGLQALLDGAPEGKDWIPPWKRPGVPEFIKEGAEAETPAAATPSESKQVGPGSFTNTELPLQDRLNNYVEYLEYMLDRKEDRKPIRWVCDHIASTKIEGWKAMHKTRILTTVCVHWLNSIGRLYYHEELQDFGTEMFFKKSDRSLCNISSNWFEAWLSRMTGINRQDTRYRQLYASIQNEGLRPGVASGVIPEHFWARRDSAVYISNGVGQMAKITASAVSLVDNGTDGVLFPQDKTLEPWELTSTPQDPFLRCSVWAEAEAAPQARLLFELWAIALPFNSPTKPPMCVTGGPGSGKTTLIKALFALFGMQERTLTIDPGERGEANFWPSINTGGLVVADNVDTNIRWLPNALEAASTGGMKEQKRLYTDDELIRLKARAAISVTSVRPMFAASMALADRMLFVAVKRRRDKATKESELFTEIRDARNDGLTYICNVIRKVLADKEPAPQVNRRHPDFGKMAVKIGRAIGRQEESMAALRKAEADKYIYNVKNSSIGPLLMGIVTRPVDGLKAGDILQKIEDTYGKATVIAGHWNTQKIGRALEGIEESLKITYNMTKQTRDHSATYSFKPEPYMLEEAAEVQPVIPQDLPGEPSETAPALPPSVAAALSPLTSPREGNEAAYTHTAEESYAGPDDDMPEDFL